MSDKEYKGVWMPKEIVADEKLAPLEKIIWSMAASLPEHLRMADATIAERIGTTPKNVAKILAKMVNKGYLRKSGSHNHRCFHPITPKGVVAITPKGEVEGTDYPKSSNQLPQKGESITPKGDHRKQEKTIENKEAKVIEFKAASPRTEEPQYELDPETRRANHKRNMENAIACGLIKAK